MQITRANAEIPTKDLVPYAKNARTHSKEQVAQIAASMKEWGFTNPILVDEQNGIIAGHGRVLAAQSLKLASVPAVVLAGLTDAQKRALVIADNSLALNAGWDEGVLFAEIGLLNDAGFDISLLGLEDIGLENTSVGAGAGSLAEKFMVPPFSVMNAREGWWQERKQSWIALGIQSELGRGGGDMEYQRQRDKNSPGGSARPACDYSKNQRGDGKGRPIQ